MGKGDPTSYLGEVVNHVGIIKVNRAPLPADIWHPSTGKKYKVGQKWNDTLNNKLYTLTAIIANLSTWLEDGSGGGSSGMFADVTIDAFPSTYTGAEWKFDQGSVVTTDATVTDIVSIALAEEEMISVRAFVSGHRDDGTEAFSGNLQGCFRRDTAGNVTLVGSVNRNIDHDFSGSPDANLVADIAAQSVDIQGTGEAAKNVVWKVDYHYSKTLLST